MKTKYVLVLMAMMFVISGCREEVTKEVGDTTINIAELNGKREIDKNDKIFANNNQGKHDLLMLMANSVDHYNLISGTMLSTLSYQGQKSESKYIFQVNVPEYQSYIYLVPSKNEESQVTFRDSERMYFFVGDLVSLNNNLDELINKQMMTVEDVSKDDSLFKYKDLTLEERVENMDISRVANDLFGDVAPYLLPEDIALRQIGTAYNNYEIKGEEKYLNRDTYRVEGKINDSLYNSDSTFSVLVDKQTGIVLKYTRTTKDSLVEMKMEGISIDEMNEENMYAKYLSQK